MARKHVLERYYLSILLILSSSCNYIAHVEENLTSDLSNNISTQTGLRQKEPSLKDCSQILEKFKNPHQFLVEPAELQKRFSLIRDLGDSSKSGAYPAIVWSFEYEKNQFIKIFSGMPSAQILQHQSFLELFQSCRLAKLNLNVNLPEGTTASQFFTDVYEVGFLSTPVPFDTTQNMTQSNYYYPYVISEAINNITLTDLALLPLMSAQSDILGFDLDSAPPMVIESILLQIIVALKNAYLAYKLIHNDLHTGNILLSTKEKADFNINYNGKEMQLAGPLIKIIDFGLSESDDLPQKNSLNFDLWIKQRPFILELEEFIAAVRGRKDIGFFARRNIGTISKNQDIRMFNLIIRALKYKLNKRGSIVPDGKYCKDYDDCINFVSLWWK